MNQSIRILHLEDDAADAELVEAILESAGMVCRITRVQTGDAFGEALRQSEYDIILADFRLPAYDGMSALRLAQQLARDVPFIFVSGVMGEDAAIEALTQGATDYVPKQGISRLAPAINRALRDAENRRERKQAEEALKKAHEDLKRASRFSEALLSAIPTPAFYKDKEGRYLGCNSAFSEFMGVTSDQLRGKTVEELWPSEHAKVYHLKDLELMKKAARQTYEFKVRDKDGVDHPVIYAKNVFRDENDQVAGIVGAFLDITERKRAEEALRTSEIRYRIVADNTYAWEYWISPDRHLLYTSPSCQRVTGYAASEFETDPKLLSRIVHPDDLAQFEAHLEPDQDGSEPCGLEFRIIHRDGTTRWIAHVCQPVFDAQGRFLGRRGSNRDITKRKWAEAALLESELRYRNLVESSHDWVWEVDQNGVYTFASPQCRELLGYEPEELIGKKPFDLMPPDEARRVEETFASIAAQRKPFRVLVNANRHKDGRIVLLETNGVPVLDEEGNLRGYRGMDRDITKLKQAEAERIELERQLQQVLKAESLGRMAGAIAHHFNNQLGAVMGNLELAMIDLPSGSEVQASLAEAMKASHRASEVSALMLTYLGQTLGKREPLDLSEVCRRSLPLLQAVIPKAVVMDHDLPSPGPTVSANPNQIQQVLTNLITNAWEAVGDDQGAIHLTLKTVSSVEIPAAHRFPIDWQPLDNAYACLEVMDTDYGISDKDMEKIFDPFFSTKFTGRGLGLSVVLGIVRAHGGVVTVESEPGRGSVFRVFFPMSAEGVPRQLDKVAKTPEMEEGGTVLLVEDEEMMRNVAATILTHLGFTVLAAKDGVDAVEVFRQHENEIRCVLCDLTMPRMNGWETVAALRALRPGIPVVLASGYDEAKVMEGKHAELPQAFLHKPYRLLELKAALGAAMGASSAESMKGD